MLAQLSENASKNPKKPGEAFGRIPATRTRNGKTEAGFKVYRVDLNNNRLTITEEWSGSETARRTTRLNELGDLRAQYPDARAVRLPDPGPATATFHRLPFRAADLDIDDELRDGANRHRRRRAARRVPQMARRRRARAVGLRHEGDADRAAEAVLAGRSPGIRGRPPTGASALAHLVGTATDAEMLRGPMQASLLFVVHGQTLERWEVCGELPCAHDDFVRAVVQHSNAEGAAMVHPCTITFPGELTRRGIAIIAQRDGLAARRVLPLTFAPDGTIGSLDPVDYEEWTPDPEGAWIGVPPSQGTTLGWEATGKVPGGVLGEG